jgi:hypothetical protein
MVGLAMVSVTLFLARGKPKREDRQLAMAGNLNHKPRVRQCVDTGGFLYYFLPGMADIGGQRAEVPAPN